MTESSYLFDDNPATQDLTGLHAVAVAVANVAVDARFETLTVGLNSPWGGGKSTALNLIEQELRPQDLLEVTRAAVLALGLDRVVVHVEVMVTATGCKIVEVNGRLGGDLIPYLGSLVTGVRPGAVAGHVAMGVQRAAEPTHDPSARCAGIQFFYPERDLVFEDIEVDDALVDASWCESVRILGQLGMEARLPPRGFLARLACAVVVADTPAMLTEHLNAAARGVRPVGQWL